ncbi:hypothetical protein CKM354_000233900 [Cercospora kikuchii]|uniref:F-box domain-containing protein n=1 Tax=Cercospora kikuchii TaxID=84275 RepID=A0A9P3FCP1_9PEZI|nr:uncharacterized protein CKM354_000233900 [Cercospora kikuchii]GIZ38942.1 hypothetical protein CKM354_000233900 [Cercospora kikuchii]
MASLLTLPTELLVLILEHVGGRELRRSETGKPAKIGPGWRATDKLLLSREWYAAARPVFLSGLHVSELRLYACNLDRLDGELSYNEFRYLMHKNTRSLSIRLLGHFWDLESAEDLERWHAEDSWSGPSPPNEESPGFDCESEGGELALAKWRDEQLRPKLDELFGDLRHFSVLRYLDFTATSDPDCAGLDWDYIYVPTISRLLQNLPITHSLRTLVLDTAGSRLLGENGQTHLCTEIAQVLPYIENVRLRMISVCPAIFEVPGHARRGRIALRTLILKLHLPDAFEHTDRRKAEPCQFHANLDHTDALHSRIMDAAPMLLDRLSELRGHKRSDSPITQPNHGMTGFAISYRHHPRGRPQYMLSPIVSINCLNDTLLEQCRSGWLVHDDGRPRWLELMSDEVSA